MGARRGAQAALNADNEVLVALAGDFVAEALLVPGCNGTLGAQWISRCIMWPVRWDRMRKSTTGQPPCRVPHGPVRRYWCRDYCRP